MRCLLAYAQALRKAAQIAAIQAQISRGRGPISLLSGEGALDQTALKLRRRLRQSEALGVDSLLLLWHGRRLFETRSGEIQVRRLVS